MGTLLSKIGISTTLFLVNISCDVLKINRFLIIRIATHQNRIATDRDVSQSHLDALRRIAPQA